MLPVPFESISNLMPSICPRKVELCINLNFYISRVIGTYLDIRTKFHVPLL